MRIVLYTLMGGRRRGRGIEEVILGHCTLIVRQAGRHVGTVHYITHFGPPPIR